MEDATPIDAILQSPGLWWIAAEIFVRHLDNIADFVNCELVCKKWQHIFIHGSLWKKRLWFAIANKGSSQRHLLESNPEWTDTSSIEMVEEEHIFYRSLAFQFSKKSILSAWKRGRFTLKKVSSWPIIRELSEVGGDKIVLAQGCSVQVAYRTPSLIKDDEYGMRLQYDLAGHRREITCIHFDKESSIAVAGGRDRNLTSWDIEKGALLVNRSEAHDRLITSVKIYKKFVFSSSRDKTVKVWDLLTMEPHQVLLGHHAHSVWGIDVRNDFLVTSSADKSLNVWVNDSPTDVWTFQSKLDNEDAPLRNVVILEKTPNLALSGDLLGDLKVWNLSRGQLEYTVPDPGEQGLFRKSGSIVSLSQTLDVAGAAFSNKSIALFSTEKCLTQLTLLNLITIDHVIDRHSFIRNILVTDGRVYICNVSGSVGLVICDIIWR